MHGRSFLLAFLLFPALAGSASADVAKGVAAFERGDYKAAVDEWLVDAAAGDPDALFNLGQAYRLGRGVEKDIDKAESYYKRAATAGHPAAMGNLGTLYYFSKTPPMVAEALQWWRQGAAAGDPRSQYMLGALIFNGKAGPRDLPQAYAWTSLAAKAGLPDARQALATMAQYVPDNARESDNEAEARMSETGRRYWQSFLPRPAAVAEKAAPPAFPEAAPPAPREETPPAALEAPPAYRVNLATLPSRADAETARQRLVARHGTLLATASFHVAALERNGKTIYRLQTGAYADSDTAGKACAAYKAAGVDCFVARATD